MVHPGGTRSRSVAVATVATLGLAGLSGCGVVDRARGCTAADAGLVAAISDARRVGEAGIGDVRIDHVEIGKAVTVDLPDDLQQYGADRLLATRATVFSEDPPSAEFAGVVIDSLAAVSSDGELLAPLSRLTDLAFDIAGPDDPDWRAWAAEVEDSGAADSARGCIDPDA